MKKILLFLLTSMLMLEVSCSIKRSAVITFETGDIFPAEKGMSWVYEGTVRHPVAAADKTEITTRRVGLLMQVVGAVKKPNCTVFIVRGYPGDVNWCTGEIKRKSYLSIRTSMGKIFLAQASNEEALDRVSFEAGHNVDVLYRRIELPLAWPLEEGQKICDDDALGESGISNCWLVEEVQTVSLGRIRGIPSGATARQYRLVLRTGPDMQEVFLVPGIGIVRYRYRHHGTLFESDLSLVEFQKPAGR